MINFNDLRTSFTSLTMPQKKEFVQNLGEQIQKMEEGAQKKEYRDFLTECINSYNTEAKHEKKPAPKKNNTTPAELRELGRQQLYGLGGQTQNAEKGLEMLNTAAKVGNEDALMDLVTFYTQRHIHPDNATVLFDHLEQLVSKHSNPMGMILLGNIYCGSPNNREIKNYPKLASLTNTKSGFTLITTGYDVAKKSKITLDCPTYEALIESYFHVKHLGRQAYEAGKATDCPFWSQGHKSFERLVLLLKENIVSWREGRGVPGKYPIEAREAMLNMNIRSLSTLIKPQELTAWLATLK